MSAHEPARSAESVADWYELGKGSERDLVMAYLLEQGLGAVALEIARGAHIDGADDGS
jgi:hypothetical protein